MAAASLDLEGYWKVIAAIHAAAASPERWLEAVLAVARLATSSGEVYFALGSFDRLGVAALIVNGDGAVVERNASAEPVLARAGVGVGRGGLCFELLTTNCAFAEALRGATGPKARSSRIFFGVQGGQVCELTVSPLSADRADLPLAAARLALVVIAPPRPDERAPLQRVRLRYGLTGAEARVTAGLCSGASVDEIARAHGVQVSTVRAQLRSIFDKTGVTRQSDLVRLSLSR